MSPEERLGADTRLTTLASVTEVVISGDLQVWQAQSPVATLSPMFLHAHCTVRFVQVAKVYVSFFGAFIMARRD